MFITSSAPSPLFLLLLSYVGRSSTGQAPPAEKHTARWPVDKQTFQGLLEAKVTRQSARRQLAAAGAAPRLASNVH